MPDDAFRTFELRGWQQAVTAYADYWTTLTSQTSGPLLDSVHTGPGTRLLDVACGTGFLAAHAASRGAQATGVDFSAGMLAQASARNPAMRFCRGDAETLPFADGSFTALVINFGMLHFARPEHALRSAQRVLAPGGRAAFTVWAAPERARAFGVVYDAIRKHGTLDVSLPAGPPFFRFSDPKAAEEALRASGFAAPTVQELPLRWRLPSDAVLLEAFLGGTARTGPLLRAQTPAAFEKILAAIQAALREFQNAAGELEIPMPAVLAVGGRK